MRRAATEVDADEEPTKKLVATSGSSGTSSSGSEFEGVHVTPGSEKSKGGLIKSGHSEADLVYLTSSSALPEITEGGKEFIKSVQNGPEVVVVARGISLPVDTVINPDDLIQPIQDGPELVCVTSTS